ncbi:hypothetical protein LWI28_009387 [Acer negundo]|uniref:Uncharacterized protein n=1 Tax=Acer negundo TaxID=4023 RepID=A0AAD5ITH2_ACENE|nr:hypothetical protein LWI28_009387 [Acer negundo]
MGKITCAKCRSSIQAKMAKQARINSTLVDAIRMAMTSKLIVTGGSSKGCNFFHNQDHPRCGQRGMEKPMLRVARYLSPCLQIILDLSWVCWLERPGRAAMGCALSTSCRNCWTVETWCSHLCSLEDMKMMRIMESGFSTPEVNTFKAYRFKRNICSAASDSSGFWI